MSFIQIEYANVISADKLRKTERSRLVKEALAEHPQQDPRNPVRALAQLVGKVVKQMQAHRLGVKQVPAALNNVDQ